jgi:hypothetical protein
MNVGTTPDQMRDAATYERLAFHLKFDLDQTMLWQIAAQVGGQLIDRVVPYDFIHGTTPFSANLP